MVLLPSTKAEMDALQWQSPDFVLVSGDAYLDHPSFGAAIIGRVLTAHGYKVAVLSQPRWHHSEDFATFGNPKLGFLVTAGNIDSMVAHYTVAKRRRHDDAYTPGGKGGKRPDRAVKVYCRRIREVFPHTPIIIGGIEASLRRFAHYDYWSDKVMPSILMDSGADLLVYGMGERAIVEIAALLRRGRPIFTIHRVRGTVYAQAQEKALPKEYVNLADFAQAAKDKKAYAAMTKIQMENIDALRGKGLVQGHGDMVVVQNPPALPLTTEELDAIYALPYTYDYPSRYKERGGVAAFQETEFSLSHNRGCFGQCNFCAISLHQGAFVTARSHRSVLEEARKMTQQPNFKGYISDVGGPTANFRGPACAKQTRQGSCAHKKCLFPSLCPSIRPDHKDYVRLLRALRELPGVEKVFIRSGLRYDYLLADPKQTFLDELVKHHIGGQLRVAPEHCSPEVLAHMGKPNIALYHKFSKAFYNATQKAGKEQYLLPYLMSSHPGSTLHHAIELALWLKKERIYPEQVQDFYPTPGTVSTAMYYTGINPYSGKEVYVAKTASEKHMQRALLQFYQEKNRKWVEKALIRANRRDLLSGSKALLPHKAKASKERRNQPISEPHYSRGRHR